MTDLDERIDALTHARAYAAETPGPVRTLVEIIDEQSGLLRWAWTQLSGLDPLDGTPAGVTVFPAMDAVVTAHRNAAGQAAPEAWATLRLALDTLSAVWPS
jgi:hypothetical protein